MNRQSVFLGSPMDEMLHTIEPVEQRPARLVQFAPVYFLCWKHAIKNSTEHVIRQYAPACLPAYNTRNSNLRPRELPAQSLPGEAFRGEKTRRRTSANVIAGEEHKP